jgi:hypothetical protein
MICKKYKDCIVDIIQQKYHMTLIISCDKLQEMHEKEIERAKGVVNTPREEKIKHRVELLTRRIVFVNTKGCKELTNYIYNYDNNFATDVANRIMNNFPDSHVIINDSTTMSLLLKRVLNTISITVSWE